MFWAILGDRVWYTKSVFCVVGGGGGGGDRQKGLYQRGCIGKAAKVFWIVGGMRKEGLQELWWGNAPLLAGGSALLFSLKKKGGELFGGLIKKGV